MTSFLNKKNTLILLIISTMIIALSITSVSAAYNDTWTNTTITNVTVDGKDATGNLLFGQDSFTVNGTYSKEVWTWTQGNNTAALGAGNVSYAIFNVPGSSYAWEIDTIGFDSPVWKFDGSSNVLIGNYVLTPTVFGNGANLISSGTTSIPTIATTWYYKFDYVDTLNQSQIDALNLTPDKRFMFNNWSSSFLTGGLPSDLLISGWLNTTTGNGTVTIHGPVADANGTLSFAPINTTNAINGKFSIPIHTTSLKVLGSVGIAVSDETANETDWVENLTAIVRADVIASPIRAIGPVVMGQVATFTFNITGPKIMNTADRNSGLDNVTVVISLPDGTTQTVLSEHGVVTFTWLVSQMGFSINASTLFDATNASFVMNNLTYNNYSYSVFYNDTTTFGNFTNVLKGQSNITQVWFDSTVGYLIGDNATIFWTLDGVVDAAAKEFVLFFFSNGIDQRGSVRVLANLVPGLNNTYYYVMNPAFSQAHDNLTVVVVFPEDAEYLRSEGRNSTFVDRPGERRTTINVVSFPVAGLKVGVQSEILVEVLAFDGTVVQNGQVTFMWDNNPEWAWTTDISSGRAMFMHTYSLAGARTLTMTFSGDTLGNKSSSLTNNYNITKGNIGITVAQNPLSPFVGENVAIAAHVNNIAVGGTPQYINFNFKQGNVLLHTSGPVAIDKVSNSTGIAQFNYAYKQTHNSLTIEAEFAGDNGYNAAKGTLTGVVVRPAPTL